MRLAQQLYDGVDIGGQTAGLITYMGVYGVEAPASYVVPETVSQQVRDQFGSDTEGFFHVAVMHDLVAGEIPPDIARPDQLREVLVGAEDGDGVALFA